MHFSPEQSEFLAVNSLHESFSSREILQTGRRILGKAAIFLSLTVGLTGALYLAENAAGNVPLAMAGTDDYPDTDATDCTAIYGMYSWCKGDPRPHRDISSRGYGYRNCTDWAAYRANKLTGVAIPTTLGNAQDWNDNAPSGWQKDSSPEPGDIAQAEIPPGQSYGHVGVVEDVTKNAQNKITSITVSEYNQAGTGNYTSTSYAPDANGVYWRDGAHTKKWDNFIDINGTGKGINGDALPGSGSSGRTVFVNSLGAAYGKDELEGGGWHPLTGNNDAVQISASGTQVALVNGAGQAWGADVSKERLSANAAGLQPLNVPLTPGYPGGVRKIATDSKGNMMAINNCGAAYGWRNSAGEQRWVPMTSCGDAYDVDVGNARFALRNSCNGGYVSDTGYAWSEVLPCGNVKKLAIGDSGRMMVLNTGNTAYIYNPGQNTWVNKTPEGDARDIAIGRDRIMVITGGGAAWAADISPNNYQPMTRLSADGDARAISVGENERMGFINGGGAAFASDTIITNGKWTQQSGVGDARLVAVG